MTKTPDIIPLAEFNFALLNADSYTKIKNRMSTTKGTKYSEATGNIGIENLKKPYPAIFKSMAAKITEPAVGASTCASGSHV